MKKKKKFLKNKKLFLVLAFIFVFLFGFFCGYFYKNINVTGNAVGQPRFGQGNRGDWPNNPGNLLDDYWIEETPGGLKR